MVDYKNTNSKVIVIEKKFNTRKFNNTKREWSKVKRCSSRNLTNGYLDFEVARSKELGIKLENESEWRKYLKTEFRLWNITTNPSKIYKDDGWISMTDWLGTKKDIKHETEGDFEIAMWGIVRKQNLKSHCVC